MTGVIATIPRVQFSNALGIPLAGGKLTTYLAGTTTPEPTFQDQDLTIANPTTITLDATGSCTLWLDPAKTYKFLLKNLIGVTQPGWPVDNISGASSQLSLNPSLTLYAKLTALIAATGSTLMGFIQSGVGALARTVQDELRERVSVTQFGAKGDGVTDDTVAFTNAATRAAQTGATVDVPAPAVKYLLSSSPTIPRNTGVRASPSWFSGPGLMPFHRFIQKSEGVDPRAFNIKSLNYAESDQNETQRKWVVVGWLDITDGPATGYEGTLTDGVGVDGRVRVSAPNGRGWASAFLAQLDLGATGSAQVYGQEIDVNNNLAHCDTDANPIARGQVTASGGNFRPRSAYFVQATKTPANGLGDNRFNFGFALYTDSCYEAGIYAYDGITCPIVSVPTGSRGIQYRGNSNLDNYYTRMNPANFDLEHTISPNRSIRFLTNAGQTVVAIGESAATFGKPINYSNGTFFSVPASVNADLGDQLTFGVAGTVAGGLIGGAGGNRLVRLINASGGPVTLNRNANMRTAAGAAVVIANLQSIQFECSGGTFFQVGPSNNA
jgi:hypothetical protein